MSAAISNSGIKDPYAYSSQPAQSATAATCEVINDSSNRAVQKSKPLLTFSFPSDGKQYSVHINEGYLEVHDEAGAAFRGFTNDLSYIKSTHMLGDKFYMALRMRSCNAYSICCFDRTTQQVESIVVRVVDPHFLDNRLIELGTGCNRESGGIFSGTGCVVTIYDLDKPEPSRELDKIRMRSGNWSVWVDEEEKKIVLQEQCVDGRKYSYSLAQR